MIPRGSLINTEGRRFPPQQHVLTRAAAGAFSPEATNMSQIGRCPMVS